MWDPLVISGNKWPKAQQGAQGMGGPSASRRRIPPFIFTHLPTRLPNSLTKSHLSEEAMVNSILLNYISPAIWLCPGLLWRVKVCPSQESIWYTFGVYQEIYSFGLISEALRRKKSVWQAIPDRAATVETAVGLGFLLYISFYLIVIRSVSGHHWQTQFRITLCEEVGQLLQWCHLDCHKSWSCDRAPSNCLLPSNRTKCQQLIGPPLTL